MLLKLDRQSSPVGKILLITDTDGVIRALDFHDFESRMLRLLKRHYGSFQLTSGKPPSSVSSAINAYFDGNLSAIEDLPVATGGTEFQRRVWGGLRQIPARTTISYGRLAKAIGRPSASRAVGMANGANPVAIVIPCHRVVGASGALTGYGGGLSRKRWLLAHEDASVEAR